MTTKVPPKGNKERRRASKKARGSATRLQIAALALILGLYLGLFGLLPRLDAWREEGDQGSDAQIGGNGGNVLTLPPTPQPLVMPTLPPLRVTPLPLARITPPPLRLPNTVQGENVGGTLAGNGGQTGQGAMAPVQVQPMPVLPPVQLQPLPTLPPLPPVAAPAPVGRSRGS